MIALWFFLKKGCLLLYEMPFFTFLAHLPYHRRWGGGKWFSLASVVETHDTVKESRLSKRTYMKFQALQSIILNRKIVIPTNFWIHSYLKYKKTACREDIAPDCRWLQLFSFERRWFCFLYWLDRVQLSWDKRQDLAGRNRSKWKWKWIALW